MHFPQRKKERNFRCNDENPCSIADSKKVFSSSSQSVVTTAEANECKFIPEKETKKSLPKNKNGSRRRIKAKSFILAVILTTLRYTEPTPRWLFVLRSSFEWCYHHHDLRSSFKKLLLLLPPCGFVINDDDAHSDEILIKVDFRRKAIGKPNINNAAQIT